MSFTDLSIKVCGTPAGTTADHIVEGFVNNGVATMTDVHIPSMASFVMFASEEETQRALEECGGLAVNGVLVNVELSTPPKSWTAPSLLADALAFNPVD
eukprot:CAMPEP_0117490710 /NCGR_PEP_ID=MMETSP0784-20121206/17689_1 /TAXON_ID=39447 /ORGANISM="" /LENGTH=98 /DNA_ID=CAMNT_0005285473 /DNA_START=24 /DNA_END=321 /DNA_ORIENTATION=+